MFGDRLGPGHDARPLVAAGQEVGRPDLPAGVGQVRREHDERRQVLVHRPQAVAHPRADARPGERHRAGVDAERGLEVVGVVVAHRADQAQVVGTLGDVREQLADPQAGLAALLELPLRPLEVLLRRPGCSGRTPRASCCRHLVRLVVVGDQLRLVVERIDVRHAAAHVQEDDPLRPRRKCGGLRRERIGRRLHRASAASSSDTMPGSSSDPPTSERMQRSGARRRADATVVSFMERTSSIHKHKLVAAQQCAGQVPTTPAASDLVGGRLQCRSACRGIAAGTRRTRCCSSAAGGRL